MIVTRQLIRNHLFAVFTSTQGSFPLDGIYNVLRRSRRELNKDGKMRRPPGAQNAPAVKVIAPDIAGYLDCLERAKLQGDIQLQSLSTLQQKKPA